MVDLEVQTAKFMSWVPVTASLPDPHEDVLVTVDDGHNVRTIIAWYDSNDGLWREFRQIINDDVTAWMSLPEPYKMEKDDVRR